MTQILDKDNCLCDSEIFLKVFNEYGKDEGSFFGEPEADFKPEKIDKIFGPNITGNVHCYQLNAAGDYHGGNWTIRPDVCVELTRFSEGQFHGRELKIYKTGKVEISYWINDNQDGETETIDP